MSLGGVVRVVARVEQFLAIVGALGGAVRANIFPPVTIIGRIALGGAATAKLRGIPKQIKGVFSAGGVMTTAATNVAIELMAAISGGGEVTARMIDIQLGAVFSGGGDAHMSGALRRRLRAVMALGGTNTTQLTRKIALIAAMGGGGTVAVDLSTDMTLDVDAQSIVDNMTTPPSSPYKAKLNTAVLALKSNSLWNKLKTFHMFDTETEQAALIDWKNPSGTKATNQSCTFTANDCFTRTSSSQRIEIPFTASSPYTQNDASAGVYVKEGAAGDNRYLSTNRSAGGFLTITLNSTPQMQSAMNDAAADTYTRTGGTGLYFASRNGGTTKRLQKVNTVLGTATTASTSVPTCTLLHVFDAAYGSGGSAIAAFTGSALTQAEGNTLDGIIANFVAA
jgi:hypothetical protein